MNKPTGHSPTASTKPSDDIQGSYEKGVGSSLKECERAHLKAQPRSLQLGGGNDKLLAHLADSFSSCRRGALRRGPQSDAGFIGFARAIMRAHAAFCGCWPFGARAITNPRSPVAFRGCNGHWHPSNYVLALVTRRRDHQVPATRPPRSSSMPLVPNLRSFHQSARPQMSSLVDDD